MLIVNGCRSSSTGPSVKSVPIKSFPVVDLKGVSGKWATDDVHLDSDGSGSVCLGTPMGNACSDAGSPSFTLLDTRNVLAGRGTLAKSTLSRILTPDPTAKDQSLPARYARAIAWYRKGALGSALLGIDGLIKEYPNDPYFHEVRGQMLYDNGRSAEAVISYRKAAQLLPSSGLIKIDFARALLATNNSDNDREAVRNLELAAQQEPGSFDLWRMMAEGYSKLNNPGMTSLARAEMAAIRGNKSEAATHADAATRQLQAGTPAWQRAQDLKAYINTRPKGGR